MTTDRSLRPAPHPLSSLLILLGLALTGALVGAMLSFFVALMVTGIKDMTVVMELVQGRGDNLDFFRIVQAGSSIGMFLLPPFFLGMIEGNKWMYIEREKTGSPVLFVIVLLLVLACAPLIEWLGHVNSGLRLPESWASLEQWMIAQEKQMEEITLALLADISLKGLISNLIVIAVIAAVGEELLFRGALQGIMRRWIRNPHLVIWVVAIIFSAIHMQFFGFLPRLFLGVVFGYLYYWSRNIWVPIVAHFVNNASVIMIAYIMQKQGKSLESLQNMENWPPYTYLLSLMLCCGALYYFWRNTHGKRLDKITGRDESDRNRDH